MPIGGLPKELANLFSWCAYAGQCKPHSGPLREYTTECFPQIEEASLVEPSTDKEKTNWLGTTVVTLRKEVLGYPIGNECDTI